MGNQLGLTAASAENADSFEVFKLVLTTDAMTPDSSSGSGSSDPYQNSKRDDPVNNAGSGSNPSSSDPPTDQPASSIPVSAQFADLHNRLQSMMKHISALSRDVTHAQSETQSRYNSIDERISRLERLLSKLDSLSAIDKKMTDVQADVRQTKADLHSALDRQVASLRGVVTDGHKTMLGSLPGIMGYILVVLAAQGVTVVGYMVYKKRKNAGPKKYI